MKIKLFTVIMVTFIVNSVIGQIPQAMNYQAVAHNSLGAVLQNQHVSTRFSIHDGSINAAIVYQETDTATTNEFGLFTTSIGTGTVTAGTFTGINWATGNKYLEVELDPAGGSTFTDMGTTELMSVPYALYAQTSGNGGGLSHYVGQLYGGGIIVSAWKDTTGTEHGLIASLIDLADTIQWSNITTLIGPTAEDPANGAANTLAIMNQSGATYGAAFLCHNYTGGGYTDWYLPAIWELQQCCNASVIIRQILGSTNGFQNLNYWSSTEYTNGEVWYEYFPNPYATNPTLHSRTLPATVRAVRMY